MINLFKATMSTKPPVHFQLKANKNDGDITETYKRAIKTSFASLSHRKEMHRRFRRTDRVLCFVNGIYFA